MRKWLMVLLLAGANPGRFPWPGPEVFASAWERGHRAKAAPIYELSIGGASARRFIRHDVELHGETLTFFTSLSDDEATLEVGLKLAANQGFIAEQAGKTVKVDIKAVASKELTPEVAQQLTYVETLLDEDAQPAQVADDQRKYDSELVQLVAGLGASPAAIQAWAESKRNDEKLSARFRRAAVFGTCSVDMTPQRMTRAHAELAYARGELGRFLQLQVAIMGDRFERPAYSSYGEEAHGTESARLASTGLELSTFLMGLLWARDGKDGHIDPRRLARSIREAGKAEVLQPRLEAIATDAAVDELNRLRAAQAWFFLELERTDEQRALERAGSLPFSDGMKAWLKRVG